MAEKTDAPGPGAYKIKPTLGAPGVGCGPGTDVALVMGGVSSQVRQATEHCCPLMPHRRHGGVDTRQRTLCQVWERQPRPGQPPVHLRGAREVPGVEWGRDGWAAVCSPAAVHNVGYTCEAPALHAVSGASLSLLCRWGWTALAPATPSPRRWASSRWVGEWDGHSCCHGGSLLPWPRTCLPLFFRLGWLHTAAGTQHSMHPACSLATPPRSCLPRRARARL